MTANLARLLQRDGVLSRLYAGHRSGADLLPGVDVVELEATRALSALPRFARCLRSDRADVFLLTLGYVNLAPAIRMLRPSAHIVLRIGNTPTPELRTLGRVARARYKLGLRIAMRSADKIIVQCDHMGKDLGGHFTGVRHKLETIYNFVEDDLWDYSAPAEPPLASPYLFCAASFKPQKAHDVLLAAYARSEARRKGVRLVVAGVTPDNIGFQKLLGENGLTDTEVIRLGNIADPYRWIVHAKLCVLASRYEGFSNFLLECAALGKCIVATNSPGGNAELFAYYPNVISVPVDDPLALAGALGAEGFDIGRGEARKLLHPFEKDGVYARYRELLLEHDPAPSSAVATVSTGNA